MKMLKDGPANLKNQFPCSKKRGSLLITTGLRLLEDRFFRLSYINKPVYQADEDRAPDVTVVANTAPNAIKTPARIDRRNMLHHPIVALATPALGPSVLFQGEATCQNEESQPFFSLLHFLKHPTSDQFLKNTVLHREFSKDKNLVCGLKKAYVCFQPGHNRTYFPFASLLQTI